MEPLSDRLNREYTLLLELAIVQLRYRIRYQDAVTLDEIHDYLDSLHNVGPMLRGVGGWFTPENIDVDLRRYDSRWLTTDDGAKLRRGLFALLQSIRRGEYGDLPAPKQD